MTVKRLGRDALRGSPSASELKLTPEQLTALDEVSALPPEYPGWMFARQGGGRVPRDFVKA